MGTGCRKRGMGVTVGVGVVSSDDRLACCARLLVYHHFVLLCVYVQVDEAPG